MDYYKSNEGGEGGGGRGKKVTKTDIKRIIASTKFLIPTNFPNSPWLQGIKFVCLDSVLLTLYTLTSASIFSILLSIHFF